PTLQENRAAVAQANLDNWLRKLKLAQTKVKKYRTKMRYYDKALAAKRSK
ncbi:MAG: hypothetical protein IIA66_13205, partial [Planctomycetes bacterium]|nr:hypothetical protein [Planctomycetota bacterium]